MTDTEGRTSKLAAALARSAEGTAPATQSGPPRRAIPMNGTIQAGVAQERAAPERATDRSAAPESLREEHRPAPEHRLLPPDRARPIRRRRSIAAFVAVMAVLIGAGAFLALRPGPNGLADMGGTSVSATQAPALSETASLPDAALVAQPAPEAPTLAGELSEPVLSGTVEPTAQHAPAQPVLARQTETPEQTPPALAGEADPLERPARPVAAVTPAGLPASRSAPATADPAQGRRLAPRAQPSVVTGTEPPNSNAVFDAPHSIRLHYNPATPGAADAANQLSAALTTAGARSVSVATVPFTISATHIRQYHDDDAPLARAIADEAGREAEIRDFTDFTPRPAPGLIEVWIASG